MTANGYLQLALLRRRPARAREAAGRVHGARVRRTTGDSQSGSARRSSASSTGSAASTPRAKCAGPNTPSPTMAFNILGLLVVYALQRLQHWIPLLNPQDMAAVSPDSAFNTAVSFATNTNWQGYGGETTMSYLTQMLGLTVQNFVSAATGMAVLVALIRGFQRASASTIGNFWTDLVAHDALYPAAALGRARRRARVAGRRADVLAVQDGRARPARHVRQPQDRRCRPGDQGREGQSGHRAGNGERADDCRRTRRVADRDQAARHQRRRLLQRQQRPPVREPDAAVELPRAARRSW